MSTSHVGRRQADDRERRRARVSELLVSGWTQLAIARELDTSPPTIIRDVRAIRAQWMERANRSADKWLGERLAQLDAIRAAFMPAAMSGNVAAAGVVLAAGRDLDKLLGLHQRRRSSSRRRCSIARSRGLKPSWARRRDQGRRTPRFPASPDRSEFH